MCYTSTILKFTFLQCRSIFLLHSSKQDPLEVNFFPVFQRHRQENDIGKKNKKIRKQAKCLPKWRPNAATTGLSCSKGSSVLEACSFFNHIFRFWVGLLISGTCFVSLLLILKTHRCMRYATRKPSKKSASLLKCILALCNYRSRKQHRQPMCTNVLTVLRPESHKE